LGFEPRLAWTKKQLVKIGKLPLSGIRQSTLTTFADGVFASSEITYLGIKVLIFNAKYASLFYSYRHKG
jgi:hypothetical protein